MIIKLKYRGNKITLKNNNWYYEETKELVSKTHGKMPCGHCGREYTKEGHDGCLGGLIGLMNACCGHGVVNEAYVQFWDGERVGGADARIIIDILKKYSNDYTETTIKKREEFLKSVCEKL